MRGCELRVMLVSCLCNSVECCCRIATISEALVLAKPYILAGTLKGIYIETKRPSFHDQQGLPLEQKLVHLIADAGYAELPVGSVILESFEEQVALQLYCDSCLCAAVVKLEALVVVLVHDEGWDDRYSE